MKNITAITGPLLALGFWLLDAQPGQCFYNQGGGARASTSAPSGAAIATPPAQQEYGPFGDLLRATGPMTKAHPIRFSTKYQDDETDLLYYGFRYYNASTGRWLIRDPLQETGGRNLYTFVANFPLGKVDALGQVACGGFMQMNCRQPCEDFKRIRYGDMEPGDVANGLVICCGGVKYICTYGADREKNQRAKEIVKRCLSEHERIHLPKSQCKSCDCGPSAVKDRPDEETCQEEVTAYGVGKACFEAAKSECGTDQECLKDIQHWADHEAERQEHYKRVCDSYRKRK